MFNRGNAVFVHDTLLKSIEKRVADKQRKEHVLELMQTAEDALKAMTKRRDRYLEAFSGAVKDRTTTVKELSFLGNALLSALQSSRDSFAEVRVEAQALVTEEEWQAILGDASEQSEKETKKRRDELESARRKASDKLRGVIAKISNLEDAQEKIEEAIDAFSSACGLLVDETLTQDINTHEVLRNQSATVDEMQNMYDSLNARREECIGRLAELHAILARSVPAESWKEVGEALAGHA